MITPKTEYNAHKFTYLVRAYPEHTIQQLLSLMQLPSIDINAAIWAAQDLKLIAKPDEQTGKVELLKEPKWQFGPDWDHLKETLMYCFTKLAEKETDLEENYLANWTQGYAGHDVLIALKWLEEAEQLAEYVIEDGENAYTFFTLYENRDKLWGNKQFKEPPIKVDGEDAEA